MKANPKILFASLGQQHDIRDALLGWGEEVIYWDWSGHHNDFNSAITKLAQDHKPDVIFLQIQTPGILSPHVARELSKKAYVINWTGDVRQNIDWFIQVGRNIQLTLFTNMVDVMKCRAAGVNADYLQIGFPDKIFTPQGEAKECPEIIFMANYTQGFPLSEYRRQMVSLLRNKFGNRFAVYGNSWGWGHAVPDQYEEARFYRGCKIAINLSHFNYDRYSSDRIFRLMGAGAFCLSHNYTGIGQEFKIGEHLDVWSNFEELTEKVYFYLQHEELRIKLAKEGCDLVHRAYKWSNRIEQLKQMVNAKT